MKKVPKQKRGESKQDYETPADFFSAVENRFGNFNVDLAATFANTKAPFYIDPKTDSLAEDCDWEEAINGKQAWLNPPFADVAPWAEKCADFVYQTYSGKIFLLTPASIGSNWFVHNVYRKAYVIALQGRLTFVGQTQPYPKDCILSIFNVGINGFEVWNWKNWVKLKP